MARDLSPADERRLIQASQQGNAEAAAALMAAHQSLVEFVADRYARHGQGHLRADIVQEGQLGLVQAAQRFDLERPVRFWTYARWWVRAYVRGYVDDNRRVGPRPSDRLQRNVATLLRHSTQPLSDADIAEQLGADEADVARAHALLRGRDVSLDLESSPELPAVQPTPEEVVATREQRASWDRRLHAAMQMLDERERMLVEQRYLCDEPQTLASLGRQMGVSRERARQLLTRALRKLRLALEDPKRAEPRGLVDAKCRATPPTDRQETHGRVSAGISGAARA